MADGQRPVLIDFGSARQDVSNCSLPMTAIVTEGFAPFEQYSEEGEQGPWTDLYALGAVMYTAMVGRKPPSATARMLSGSDTTVPMLAGLRGKYSPEFLASIKAALELPVQTRLRSTQEWLQRL